jgi:uncharacterized protein with HEPN domain
MSETKSVQARIASIISKCDDILFIIARHNGIVNALTDREGQPALLMLIEAIAEQFQKLGNIEEAAPFLKHFEPVTLKGIRATRNFIAHDYDGVDLAFVEAGLRQIPEIKTICENYLKEQT